MKVTIIGPDDVSLVAGAGRADTGNHVVSRDLRAARIAVLRGGDVPVCETRSELLTVKNVAAGRLRIAASVEKAVAVGTSPFIATGAPPDQRGSVDLRHVPAAPRNIGRHVTESTTLRANA